METPPRSASASNEDASVEYVRQGRHVALRIVGKIDEITVPAAAPQAAVEAARDREISQMQGAFRDLQRQLMETLPPAEKTAPIHNRATDWDESRDWCIAPSRTLTVAASQYEVQTHVTLSADRLADASIVGQVIENEIRNRELAIRAVYGQVLRDVEAAGPGPQ